MTGLSRRQLQHLEDARKLTLALEGPLRIALALGVPVEQLIASEMLADIRTQVAERKNAVELGVAESSSLAPVASAEP